MKKTTAVILLFCYSVALIRPITPVIGDILAHTFWRAQHMATVHFENGKYHVHYALQAIAKDDAGNKKSSSVKALELLDTHLSVNTEPALENNSDNFILHFYYLKDHHSAFLALDAPPPEV